MDEIGIGKINRDKFGERAPGGEARLELVFADLMVSGVALMAMTAAADKRNRDALTFAKARDVFAGGKDGSCQLMAGNMRQVNIRVMAEPAVIIGTAQDRWPRP